MGVTMIMNRPLSLLYQVFIIRQSYRLISTSQNHLNIVQYQELQGSSSQSLVEEETSNVINNREIKTHKKVIENGINNCPNNCLCSNKINIDYKNPRLLSQFVSSQTGMILPRTFTKICMKKQREIAKAIKRSRTMGFMPYTSKLPEYLDDPKLF